MWAHLFESAHCLVCAQYFQSCYVEVDFLQTNVIGQSLLDIYGKIKTTANYLLRVSNGTAHFEKCKQLLD